MHSAEHEKVGSAKVISIEFSLKEKGKTLWEGVSPNSTNDRQERARLFLQYHYYVEKERKKKKERSVMQLSGCRRSIV
jgi:hypothetical protein